MNKVCLNWNELNITKFKSPFQHILEELNTKSKIPEYIVTFLTYLDENMGVEVINIINNVDKFKENANYFLQKSINSFFKETKYTF